HSIVNNIIGYANAGGTNAYEMTSTVGIRFIGIDIAAGSAAVSSIQGNTITAIKLTTASNDVANYGAFCAIRASAGDVNIGTISGNTIGSNTGVDFITLSSTNPAALVGINAASTDTVNINKNIIGGLSSISPTVTVGPVVYGIAVTASAAALNISGNIIGNTTVNNIRAGSTSTTVASSIAYGITFSTTPSSTVISENTIQNVISYGISSSSVRGITTASAAGNTSSIIIAKNTITNLRTNGTLPNILSGQSAANGISLSIGTNNIVENNTISHIYNTTVEAVFTYAVGIAHANATNTIIRNNTIFDITNTSTSTSTTQPGVAAGILIRSATNAVNVYNNMISLGTSSDANTAFVGIQLNNAAAPDPTIQNIFHNTVNIEGTVTSGAQPSFCFYRGDFSVTAKNLNATVKNNIFTNSRSGGTGSHFAIANNYGATVNASNWISDYNVLNATASTIGYWGANKTFSDWKTSSGSDTNSYSGYAIPYVNPATDLHLNTGTTGSIVESRGQSGLTILSDIDGDVRPGPVGSTNGGGTAPDIGADEIDGVVYDFIPPAITYTAFTGTCDTTSRTLAVKIIDSGKVYITGPLLPKIYFRKNKNAWVSAQGILSSGTAKNGNWSFTISTSALGGLAANDTVSYFVIAQDLTGNITAQPSAGVIASDVNTVTSYPTTPDQYRINPTPLVLTPKGGAVCDSGKVTLTASSNYGKLYWYTVPSGGSAVDTGKTFTTPIIKATTPYYVEVIANNCISARLQVDAIVNHSTKGLPIIQTACDSLKWNGVYVKTSGTYYDTLTNSKGCDSILTLQLTITHGTSHQDTVKACGPYTWNGHTYTTSGVYKDTLATKAGCDSIVTLQLTITNLNATVTVLANLLTADSLVDSYQWIDCGTKLPISGATNKIFIALTSGTYAVIETKNGCVDTSNCIPVIITGIATNEQDQLYAYPNPGNGNYTLVLPDKANVKVVSLTGEIVFDAQLPKGTNTIELINAANGVYIMHVSTASSHQVVRLIKQD
ncbi:MAG TPA: T9SS type A sorting domain-containing protein, partial [Bacteroidia bacterium]|nr:T9SS type A sorting domain-containing protein [Bacteroidia bacterium]